MKEVKVNMIIDGNYLFNKIVFALHKGRMMPILYDTLIKTVLEYKKLYSFQSITIVSDSGVSWRKSLYSDYKGNRKKDSEIAWDYAYEEYTRFKEDIQQHNIRIFENKLVEGDDWITFLTTSFNNDGKSVLILSSDKDISQLVSFNTTNLYMNFMYNDSYTHPKIYLPNSVEVFLDEVNKNISDSLFDYNENGEFLTFFNTFRNSHEISYVDPVDVLITKMIAGDVSDNIKSVYVKTNKSGKPLGIGEAGAKKIISKYVESFGDIDMEDKDLYENLSDIICEVKKIDFHNEGEKIQNNLKINRKLIALDLRMIPTEILKNMVKIYNA